MSYRPVSVTYDTLLADGTIDTTPIYTCPAGVTAKLTFIRALGAVLKINNSNNDLNGTWLYYTVSAPKMSNQEGTADVLFSQGVNTVDHGIYLNSGDSIYACRPSGSSVTQCSIYLCFIEEY